MRPWTLEKCDIGCVHLFAEALFHREACQQRREHARRLQQLRVEGLRPLAAPVEIEEVTRLRVVAEGDADTVGIDFGDLIVHLLVAKFVPDCDIDTHVLFSF